MKKAFFIVILSLIICPMSAFSSQEYIHPPVEVSLKVNTGEQFGEVSATLISNGEEIESIKLNVRGREVVIPVKVYEYLKRPLLNTVEIRTERGYDEFPHLYLYLKLAHETEGNEWLPKEIHINFYDGKVVGLSITTPVNKEMKSWESIELK